MMREGWIDDDNKHLMLKNLKKAQCVRFSGVCRWL